MVWLPALLLAFGGLPTAPTDLDTDVDTDRFDPLYHADLVGVQDVDFDSGWVPADSPVQLRLTAHAADSVDIEMLGEAAYDWAAQTLGLTGDEGQGWFSLDVGVQIHAEVRFDVAGITWQSDVLGPFDYAIISEAMFTPYLLAGHPESPVEIADQTDGATVASVPIVPNILVASGNLDIDVVAQIEASLSGTRVELVAGESMASIQAYGESATLVALPEDGDLTVDGTMVAQLQAAPTIILRPHLVMSIVGQDFDIFGIDIPIALPPTDDEIVFDPETMVFAAPPPPPPAPGSDGDGGSASGSASGSDGGLDGTGGGDDLGGSDDLGDTTGVDDAGADAVDSGDACACASDPAPANAVAWGVLVFLLGVRRRRR